MGHVMESCALSDGSWDAPEYRDPERFRDAAELLRQVLIEKGVRVSDDEIPVLPFADGVRNKYLAVNPWPFDDDVPHGSAVN
jgi:hypothetical protein